jgi:predicted acetyltransferase
VSAVILVKPALEYLPSYVDALRRGYSPNTSRPEASAEALQEIERSSEAFLARLDDREAKSGPVVMPDGTLTTRLPGFERWMWDGEFAGSIGLRWVSGTAELPPTCLGHIGYSVVEWKRGRGYATSALAQMLLEARTLDLPYVEIVTSVENLPSQRVVLANGGVFIERFAKPTGHVSGDAFRFRIPLR